MLHKKDTRLVTLALLCYLAAAEQPAAASTFAAVLAQTPTPTALPSPTAVPGVTKLRIASSSSMEKFNEALKQRFEQQFAGQQVTIGYGDANAALRAVRQEQADLAAIGRPLTRREKARGLVEVPVARHKIAIVVGANNPFTGSLTDQQFAKIFRGEIQDWSEVGGAPGGIRVIDRPATSDIRQSLRQYPVFQAARFDTGANAVKLSEDTSQAVIRELGTDGIGIAIADQVLNQPGVRVLPMHKTTPDDPRYPFSQGLFYVYKKTNTSAALKNFLGYATAPQGQSAIAEARTAIAAATPGATPTLGTTTTPGATALLTPAATPAATPAWGTTATPAATALPTPAATPAATTAPQTTPLTTPTADAIAGTSISDGGVMGMWWLWLSSLLLFLLWRTLKNQRSQPQSNQHLSLSSLDPIEPSDSPTVRESYRFPVSSDTPTTANETKHIALATSGLVTGSAIAPSQPITEQVSSPVASALTQKTPEPVSDIPEAASGLVAGSEIPDSRENSPSPPVTLVRSTPTASQPIESTPEDISHTEAETAIAIPSVTHWTAIAAAGLVSGSDQGDTKDTQPVPDDQEDAKTRSSKDAPRHPSFDRTSRSQPLEFMRGGAENSSTWESPDSDRGVSPPPHLPASPRPLQSVSIGETVPTEGATVSLTSSASPKAIATDAAMLSDQPAMATQEEPQEVQAVKSDTEATKNADSTIVLLSGEAEWAYAYWNIPNEEKEKLRQEGGTKLALRLYDVTDIDLNNQQPQSIQQNYCNEDSRDGYLMVPLPDRDYMVEIGYVTNNDRWLMLARSAVVRIPPTSDLDRQLANVELEAMRLLSVPPVSPSILSSSGGRLGVTNLLDTSENPPSASTERTRASKFRLVADAELSVYGETEPDAKVTIDGRQIELNPTGTFSCQVLCPDGESEFTITAVAADGETDSIQIKLTRQTLKPNPTHRRNGSEAPPF
jgi:ABC-type phosphate transport system substrate-binding protein